MEALTGEMIRVLQTSSTKQLSDEKLRAHFHDRHPDKIVAAINELLKSNRLNLLKNAAGSLVYKLVEADTAAKFEGLTQDQIMVYQQCEKATNKGIWTRDIKNATNIPQHTLTKALKILETRTLIKSVRSVTSKSKKLFMLFDVVPSKEITGGPWYTEQEFDHEFVDELCNYMVNFIKSKGMADMQEIYQRVIASKISTVELSIVDLGTVIQTLVYDGRLEEVDLSVVRISGRSDSHPNYKVALDTFPPNYFTSAPCGICPVSSQCTEGGVISPNTCEYMKMWLNMPGQPSESIDLF